MEHGVLIQWRVTFPRTECGQSWWQDGPVTERYKRVWTQHLYSSFSGKINHCVIFHWVLKLIMPRLIFLVLNIIHRETLCYEMVHEISDLQIYFKGLCQFTKGKYLKHERWAFAPGSRKDCSTLTFSKWTLTCEPRFCEQIQNKRASGWKKCRIKC